MNNLSPKNNVSADNAALANVDSVILLWVLLRPQPAAPSQLTGLMLLLTFIELLAFRGLCSLLSVGHWKGIVDTAEAVHFNMYPAPQDQHLSHVMLDTAALPIQMLQNG
jgi:hypothetical protein